MSSPRAGVPTPELTPVRSSKRACAKRLLAKAYGGRHPVPSMYYKLTFLSTCAYAEANPRRVQRRQRRVLQAHDGLTECPSTVIGEEHLQLQHARPMRGFKGRTRPVKPR